MVQKFWATAIVTSSLLFGGAAVQCQLTENEKIEAVGDAPVDPGPLANDLSHALTQTAVRAAMRKVADWQQSRIANDSSRDWTFATLYLGLLAASETLNEPSLKETVLKAAEAERWTLGPRKTHADDQAIGQVYLWLNRGQTDGVRIKSLRSQFDEILRAPDDLKHPVWWWCDALFMAPPVWAGLGQATGDPRYFDYLDRRWEVTSNLLFDPQESLFFRDSNYFAKREKNGRKVFWSRGNGWVMGGLVRVLESMPDQDPRRSFYVGQLTHMAAAVAKLQRSDGLWRTGLLDADDYPLPEVSGSAFFVYAIAWGINHNLLPADLYTPVVANGWAGLVDHIYADGRLGCIQPVGEAPGVYRPSASSVFGVGAFLLAGSEVDRMKGRLTAAVVSNPRRLSP